MIIKELKQKYKLWKKIKKENKKFKYHGKFINRSKGEENLCILLAGYKEFLYPEIFKRLKNYSIKNMDICIVTSGIYSEKINNICKKNNWSYLSTEENNVSLIQNIAIKNHKNAKYIFKLDEDIFITKNYFKNMLKSYEYAKTTNYTLGVLAPLIPINGYGHARIIEKLNLENIYEERFGALKYMAGPNRKIEKDLDVAKFFWGEGNVIPSIDELNEKFSQQPLKVQPCPIRFSIGAILFERYFWEKMKYFKVNKGNGMGEDEVEICKFCLLSSMPLMVTENVVVGHLSFGNQNIGMKEYFLKYLKNKI